MCAEWIIFWGAGPAAQRCLSQCLLEGEDGSQPLLLRFCDAAVYCLGLFRDCRLHESEDKCLNVASAQLTVYDMVETVSPVCFLVPAANRTVVLKVSKIFVLGWAARFVFHVQPAKMWRRRGFLLAAVSYDVSPRRLTTVRCAFHWPSQLSDGYSVYI